jgi:hypothetical protein
MKTIKIIKADGRTVELTGRAVYTFNRKLLRSYSAYRKYRNGWQIFYPEPGYVPFLLKTGEAEYQEFNSSYTLQQFLSTAFKTVSA